MTGGFGWAKNAMSGRMKTMESTVPVSFVYGSRSWIDHNVAYVVKESRGDAYTEIIVRSVAWAIDFVYKPLISRSIDWLNTFDYFLASVVLFCVSDDNIVPFLQLVSGAGHHVYADKPDEFNDIVGKICRRVDEENAKKSRK